MIARHPLRVVAAVIIYGDQVLACRRAPNKSAAGKWEFPGGKIEPGESAQVALARELLEELELPARIGDHLDTSITNVNGVSIQLECYFAEADFVPQHSSDHDELGLFSLAGLKTLEWAEPDLPAVAYLAISPFPNAR